MNVMGNLQTCHHTGGGRHAASSSMSSSSMSAPARGGEHYALVMQRLAAIEGQGSGLRPGVGAILGAR
jgi:hypothetical protein